MATRYYTFAEHEYYHVYNRGNSKQIIFRSESDYTRFKKILFLANNTKSFKLRDLSNISVFDVDRIQVLVHVGAYCLMPNHFHILLTPAVDGGVSKFMLKLATSYASYFNKKYMRTGSLYEGSYKAKFADSDRYLKYLFSYIHLNPFHHDYEHVNPYTGKEKLVSYSHSSLPDYLGVSRQEGVILDRMYFPQYFNTIEKQEKELYEWLDFQEI